MTRKEFEKKQKTYAKRLKQATGHDFEVWIAGDVDELILNAKSKNGNLFKEVVRYDDIDGSFLKILTRVINEE